MSNKVKHFLSLLFIGCCLSSANAEKTYDWKASGSYSVGKTATVSIPEDGEVYLKLSGMKVGNAYTFVVRGSGAEVGVVYTYSEDGDEWDTPFGDSTTDLKTENQARCIVTEESWSDEYIVITDPDDKEWKVSPKGYYLCVSGDEGATISLTSQDGVQEEPIPLGDADNPKVITPTTVPTTYSAKFLDDGTYCFETAIKAGQKYLFSTTGGTVDDPISIEFDKDSSYSKEDVTSKVITAEGNVAYLLTVTKNGTLYYSVIGTGAAFGLTTQTAKQGTLGSLTVNIKGTEDGSWTIKGASGSHKSGETIPVLGEQTVQFNKVSGFKAPANETVAPTEENPEVILEVAYTDTYDPKDDTVSGATKITPSAKGGEAARTLFDDDVDHFVFTAKDGVYYNFALTELDGAAKLTVFSKSDKTETPLLDPSEKISAWAPGKGDYIVRVSKDTTEDASYTLAYSSANVGTISFAKTAVSAKKTAGSVSLSVSRSSAEGKVRVRYGTVCGDAKPGVDYVAQTGELLWENGDKKAKSITIKLLPELFAEKAISRKFAVQLEPLDQEELDEDEYQATLATGKETAIVTVTEAQSKAEKEIKPATTKTEDVPLETGTYQGVIAEDGSALTNGFPALASVTFTAKNAVKKALSAKVIVAGKTYSFAADTWDEDESDDETAVAILTQSQKIGKTTYTNTLTIRVRRGETSGSLVEPSNWEESSATVDLEMNIPDAKGSGVQESIVYAGELFRNNAKIQDYLTAVVQAAGYYTVALVPSGVSAADGIPAGNGYLTLTIDNKGKAKVAGLLADGSTKPSYSSIVAVRDDGETMLVPVFVAKSPYCFGGTLKLVRGDDGKYFVDSSNLLRWNNDNAALTSDGDAGWRIVVEPVGGYFNTVNTLQAYYLTSTISVGATAVDDWPEGFVADGSSLVSDVQPDGVSLDLSVNTLSAAKRVLYRAGSLVDLENSINPCNVQVKLARATGLVTGSFAIWTENEDGELKEKTGIKHNGILLLSRDENASLDVDVMSAGFFTLPKVKTDTKRTYTASLPFNVLAIDQGEPDWYADDWGEQE